MNKLYGKPRAAALGLNMRRRFFFTKPSNKLRGTTKSLVHGNGKPSNKRSSKSTKSPTSVLTEEDIIRQLIARGSDLFYNHDLCCHQLYPKQYPESTELDLIELDDLDFESDVVAYEIDRGQDPYASSDDDIVTDEEEDLTDPK